MAPRSLTDVRVASMRELPARIQVQGSPTVYENAGVYVRGGKLRAADSAAHLIPELCDLAVVEVRRIGRAQHEVVLADGRVVDVMRTGRCACGSPLKRFDAWAV